MVKIAQISDIHWRGIARHQEYTRAFKILFKELEELKPDIIVNTGDTYHTKTVGITPEIIEKLSWMFNELATIAPSITILGNHDYNVTNINRQDIITPIHNAIRNNNSFLYKESGSYPFFVDNKKIIFHVLASIDKENWDKILLEDDAINIALYHGAVAGSKTDTNWVLQHNDAKVSYFKKFDYTFLGDIHKNQFLNYRLDINNVLKPWIGYPGSLIQQNHGEQIKKGYFVWDIRDKNDWDVEFKKLINLSPFVTLEWLGTVEKTLKAFEELHGSYAYMPGTRFRVCSNKLIPQLQVKQLVDLLKNEKKASEVTFKTDIVSDLESITAHGFKLNKKSLSQDPETIIKLYKKFLDSNNELYHFNDEDIKYAEDIIKNYYNKLNSKNSDLLDAKNTQWSIKQFNFNNIFIYGENNSINFESLQNIVGIFGKNRTGKSGIIGGLVYTLFNGTDRGSVKNSQIINRNRKECFGSVRINAGGSDYLIERRTTRTSKTDDDKSITSVNLWQIENRNGQEVKVSKNGITRDETDKIIRSLIGTQEDFLLTALASQNDLHRFIDNKATKRKEILNRFLELDIFDRLYEYAKNDYSSLDKNNFSGRDWSKSLEKTEKEIERLEKEINAYNEKLVSLNEKKDSLNLWIKTHENNAKTYELEKITNLQNCLNDLQQQLDKNIVDIEDSKRQIKIKKQLIISNKKIISKINKEQLENDLKTFEEIKEIVSNLQKSYDVQSRELNNQKKIITKLKLVPCGNKFPNCHYIKDAHEAKSKIKTQENLVKDIYKSLENNKKLFDKYIKKNINDKLNEYKKCEINILINESEYKNLIEKIENKNNLIKSLKKEIQINKTELNHLNNSKDLLNSEEFKKKKEAYSSLISEIQILNEKKNDCLLNLGGKKDYCKNLLIEQEKNKDLLKKLNLFDSIQSAFSKNGIPVMVLKDQLPAINTEMTKVLDGLVDFTVQLLTDTTANIMDIYVEDSVYKRPIELCSGMEKTICSLALRVALGNLSSLPRPDIFVLDESFGALDEDNLQKSMELLQMFRDYFKTVLVISHINEIKEIADTIIEIENNGFESKVII